MTAIPLAKTCAVTLSEVPGEVTIAIREGGITIATHQIHWSNALAINSALSGAISAAVQREGQG